MVHKHIQVWGAARSGLWMLMPAQLCFVSKVREREGSPKPQPVSLNHLQVSQPESLLVWCDKWSRVESALYLDKTFWKCQVRVAFSSQKTPALVFPLDLYTCFPSTWGTFVHSPFHLSSSYCFFKSQFRCHFLFLTALFSHMPIWDRFLFCMFQPISLTEKLGCVHACVHTHTHTQSIY